MAIPEDWLACLRCAGSARSSCVEINQWFFFDGDTGLYARELRRAGLALVETKLCSSRCSRHSVQGHDRRPLRLGIVPSFVMKHIGEPAAQWLGALYCLTATSLVAWWFFCRLVVYELVYGTDRSVGRLVAVA